MTKQVEGLIQNQTNEEYEVFGNVGVNDLSNIVRVLDRFGDVVQIKKEGNLLTITGDKKKVDIASSRLLKINPNIQVDTYSIRLNTENIDKILSTASIILDCTDNFETRYLLNEYTILNSKILISGSAGFYDGQIMIIKEGFPCYQCLYPEIPNAVQVPSCVESAVLGPVVGVIGSLMATEAIKEISKLGQSLAGKILTYSSLTTTWQKLDFQIDTDSRCNLCKECKQYANPMA
jgi:adenylyltransferase/sulfurtransferase